MATEPVRVEGETLLEQELALSGQTERLLDLPRSCLTCPNRADEAAIHFDLRAGLDQVLFKFVCEMNVGAVWRYSVWLIECSASHVSRRTLVCSCLLAGSG